MEPGFFAPTEIRLEKLGIVLYLLVTVHVLAALRDVD